MAFRIAILMTFVVFLITACQLPAHPFDEKTAAATDVMSDATIETPIVKEEGSATTAVPIQDVVIARTTVAEPIASSTLDESVVPTSTLVSKVIVEQAPTNNQIVSTKEFPIVFTRLVTKGESGATQSMLTMFVADEKLQNVQILSETEGSSPVWAPDGNQLAFHSVFDADFHIFTLHLDDKTIEKVVSQNSLGGSNPKWSGDGNNIYFARSISEDPPTAEIFQVNLETGAEMQITSSETGTGGFDVSPSGEWIALAIYEEPRSLARRVHILNADGGEQYLLTDFEYGTAYDPKWSPDGERIAYLSNYLVEDPDIEGVELFIVSPDGTGERRLTDISEAGDILAYDWSPDGSEILFSTWEGAYLLNVEEALMEKISETYFFDIDWFNPDAEILSNVVDRHLEGILNR